jgi:hypothetical protein
MNELLVFASKSVVVIGKSVVIAGKGAAIVGDILMQSLGIFADILAENPGLAIALMKVVLAAF